MRLRFNFQFIKYNSKISKIWFLFYFLNIKCLWIAFVEEQSIRNKIQVTMNSWESSPFINLSSSVILQWYITSAHLSFISSCSWSGFKCVKLNVPLSEGGIRVLSVENCNLFCTATCYCRRCYLTAAFSASLDSSPLHHFHIIYCQLKNIDFDEETLNFKTRTNSTELNSLQCFMKIF